MNSTTRSEQTRRRVARVAMAGALAAIPLTALAVPAAAQPVVPGATEVRHDHHDRDWFGCDAPGRWDDWAHSPGHRDDCKHWDDPHLEFFHHHKPHGIFFGSS